jgi:predicted TIM-barrel fold metal-dependent hydrolase
VGWPLAEPKIDAHCHVFDPARFPYNPGTHYAPAGQEIGTAAQLQNVMDAYGVTHALLVGPNSGYELDNRCMLDAIARSAGRLKGIAVVRNDTSGPALDALAAQGVVGVAFNATFHGTGFYRDTAPLLRALAARGMLLSLQVEADQLVDLAPLVEDSGVRVMIDHCGRPVPENGIAQPGFAALLRLAANGRTFVKLSGYVKFARTPFPYPDAHPFVAALLDAFTPARCLWASDWPYLRAPVRQDFAPLLALAARFLPDAADRRRVFVDTPAGLLGFPHP